MIKKFIRKFLGVKDKQPVRDLTEPIVLGPAEHGIDPKLLSSNAIRVPSSLQEAGVKAFVLGGQVRALLLGVKPEDFATATNATPAPAAPTSPDAVPNAVAAEPVVITIKDFKYTIPASVAPGAQVTVKNDDAETHTVTSAPTGAFEVTANGGGGTATFTAPTQPGSHKFVCTFHADMAGTRVVNLPRLGRRKGLPRRGLEPRVCLGTPSGGAAFGLVQSRVSLRCP